MIWNDERWSDVKGWERLMKIDNNVKLLGLIWNDIKIKLELMWNYEND